MTFNGLINKSDSCLVKLKKKKKKWCIKTYCQTIKWFEWM